MLCIPCHKGKTVKDNADKAAREMIHYSTAEVSSQVSVVYFL